MEMTGRCDLPLCQRDQRVGKVAIAEKYGKTSVLRVHFARLPLCHTGRGTHPFRKPASLKGRVSAFQGTLFYQHSYNRLSIRHRQASSSPPFPDASAGDTWEAG